MRKTFGLALYRLILPLLFLIAFPGWVVKMIRRGGFGSGLRERAAIYPSQPPPEPQGRVHLHAVSVGETMIALKLAREWQLRDPKVRFVIATGTATGHALAKTAADVLTALEVTYSPLDFPSMVRRYLKRFAPKQIVLIEAEAWPFLLLEAERRAIPISLINARLSPRSAARYERFAAWVKPYFSLLNQVAIQQSSDRAIWQSLGLSKERIHLTGSVKFDPGSGPRPQTRPEFEHLLQRIAPGAPMILAASTHPGEEALIAQATQEAAPHALLAIAPRHAERREQVKTELTKLGFEVVLKSRPNAQPSGTAKRVLVIDTTGELRDWTAHATLVIIGKSFLATGGQNPAEAILAEKPIICGPHMENFQPLASQLLTAGGSLQAADQAELSSQIRTALEPTRARTLTTAAHELLAIHDGATRRTVTLLQAV